MCPQTESIMAAIKREMPHLARAEEQRIRRRERPSKFADEFLLSFRRNLKDAANA
jgi:hypothetical protein